MCVWTTHAGYQHTYSAEHFDDVVAVPGAKLAARSAVLVLYEASCHPPFSWYDRDQHLLYLLHDYRSSHHHIWFSRDEHDTLERRYLTQDSPCLSAHYFKKGESILEATRIWPMIEVEVDLIEWFWWHLRTEIIIKNRFHETIKVIQDNIGEGPQLDSIEILPGLEASIPSYIGYLLKFMKTNYSILDAVLVTDNMTEVVFSKKRDVSIDLIKDKDREDYNFQAAWVWSHAERHLRNAKQPLVVHNYTQHGYLKLPMPTDLYVTLHKFYQDNRDRSFDEVFDHTNGVHQNVGTRPPHMVQLSDEMKQTINNVLQPQLEEWSKTKLHSTAIYGIREYHKGNVLANHVDRIETHVISVILQIDQDKGSGEDWTLEVIDYNSQRHQVKLLPGE